MCLTFSHRSASSNIRAPRIFISSPQIISTACLRARYRTKPRIISTARHRTRYRTLATARSTENKNPGGLFSSPGFGISCLTLSSGHPTGKPRRNYRYRDNNAYYNDVDNKSADAQRRLTARGREVGSAVGTTIGHSIFQSEELGRLKQAKPV